MADEFSRLVDQQLDDAAEFTKVSGMERIQKVLARAERQLVQRLSQAEGLKGAGRDSFTGMQARIALKQVRATTRFVQKGIRDTLVGLANDSAEEAGENLADFMRRADEMFRGIGTAPIAIDTAKMIDVATAGVNSSVLSRLASSGEPIAGADMHAHPAKAGILERYGTQTIAHFQDILQAGVIAKTSAREMREQLLEIHAFSGKSFEAGGSPAMWAKRIIRTESMAIRNRATLESTRSLDNQIGGIVKIITSVFDNRTGADSYAVHGQIRRPEEAFQSWYGFYQHPPDRPNDRSCQVAFNVTWPLTPMLYPKSRSDAAKVWAREKRKGEMPPFPPDISPGLPSRAEFGKKDDKGKKGGPKVTVHESDDSNE